MSSLVAPEDASPARFADCQPAATNLFSWILFKTPLAICAAVLLAAACGGSAEGGLFGGDGKPVNGGGSGTVGGTASAGGRFGSSGGGASGSGGERGAGGAIGAGGKPGGGGTVGGGGVAGTSGAPSGAGGNLDGAGGVPSSGGADAGGPECSEDETRDCTCEARRGRQTCEGGAFGECDCTCQNGDQEPCACPNGAEGVATCQDGVFSACASCPFDPSGCPTGMACTSTSSGGPGGGAFLCTDGLLPPPCATTPECATLGVQCTLLPIFDGFCLKTCSPR
jgi:hypothetical protein